MQINRAGRGGAALPATGATLTITDSPGSQVQRFYRAVRTP